MFPTATPTKIVAEAIIFLVFPPTFPETSDKAKLNTALEEPVKSAKVNATVKGKGQRGDYSQYPMSLVA